MIHFPCRSEVAVDLSVHALRYFLTVSEEKHFGRAAARRRATRRVPSGGQQVSSGSEGSFGWGVRRATRREEPPGAVESGVADA